MENISRIQKKCVGCKSCEQSCPKNCIIMAENKEGFWYPAVDEKKCVECGRCLKACPMENVEIHRNVPKTVWALRNKNDVDIMRSASGGAADSAAKAVLQMNGIVYGAAYDEQLAVSHIEIENDADRIKIQSSKYVQSDPKDSYSKVKQKLAKGKIVLYTGTPCQIAGLYAFLGGDKPNLYTVDLICHGVPSPKFFKKYIEYQSKQTDGDVIYFNFRSKDKRGWGTQYLIKTKTKTKTKTLSLDRYGKHFMDGDCYRESCYLCAYASTNRMGDITVGDFWGIAKSHPNFFSPKGISSVFVNTEKGQELFEKMRPFVEIKQATLEEAMVKQGNLVEPSNRPEKRDLFYKNIDDDSFIENIHVGLQFKERIKIMLPASTVQFIKQKLGGVTDKVSVIIPVYNVEQYLNKCIESVCEQNYKRLEIILVDDGSTDSSGEICDTFARRDHRIQVIHKENAGVSAARNSGIEACTGDYICFVDGDDYVMPDYVSYLLALGTAYDADIALTTQMFGNFDERQSDEERISVWTGEDATEEILCYKVPIGCYCKLFKRKIIKMTRFIPEIFIGEGFNFNVDAFQKSNRVVAGKMKTYYYRRNNPTSAMTKFSIKKCECGLRALEIIKDNLNFNSKRICAAWEFANWRTHSDFYDMFVLAGARQECPDIYRKCLNVTRKKALVALDVPTTRQNKIRAIIMWICPQLIPFAMKMREYRYKAAVAHR